MYRNANQEMSGTVRPDQRILYKGSDNSGQQSLILTTNARKKNAGSPYRMLASGFSNANEASPPAK